MFNGGKFNGKVASIVATGSLVVILLTIYAFVGGGIDGKIDTKILAHEKDTVDVQHKMQQDIAIMNTRQELFEKQYTKDVKEIKEMIRNQ